MSRPLVGVLALQGDVREHRRALAAVGADSLAVRRPGELAQVDGLILPGGESTTMSRLAVVFDLLEPLRAAVAGGLPVYGTCAGMIMLADRLLDGRPDQETVGGIDMTVRRNAFGRQVDSFETDLDVSGLVGSQPVDVGRVGSGPDAGPGEPFHAVFIRAPWVESVGPQVEVLARIEAGPTAGTIVAVRQGRAMATSFHPELTGDTRVHAAFVAGLSA